MTSRSPEYEQEVVRTLRLVRGLIYAVMGIAGMFALFAVLALVLGLTVRGGSNGSPPGTDTPAPLRAGTKLGNTTEAGLFAEVTILTVQRVGEQLSVTARVRGMDANAALPETWKLYFTDNTQQPMQVEVLETTPDSVSIRASLEVPAGPPPQFLHVNPDASHGDLYFDIPPG